jgi:hypothetical protein
LGVIDTEGKKYLSDNEMFADAFNFLVYNGKKVIKAEKLRNLDTTEIIIPYGNHARVPIQKYRDVLKLWSAMIDDNAIYVILGAEIQGKVHYGMPVKNGLYDMIGYSKQVEEISRSYRDKNIKKSSEGEISLYDGAVKIKLTSEEFLSGLKKGDKLIPIITAVVYLGEKPWDGPRTLHDMLVIKDNAIKKLIPNYRINLISPANMTDKEFEKFNTELGFAMKIIKHRSKDADELIKQTNHRKIDRGTAYFLNSVAKLDLDYEEKKGGIDMCEALERRYKEKEVNGAITGMKLLGASEKDIIKKIMDQYKVKKSYVLALMNPKKA